MFRKEAAIAVGALVSVAVFLVNVATGNATPDDAAQVADVVLSSLLPLLGAVILRGLVYAADTAAKLVGLTPPVLRALVKDLGAPAAISLIQRGGQALREAIERVEK